MRHGDVVVGGSGGRDVGGHFEDGLEGLGDEEWRRMGREIGEVEGTPSPGTPTTSADAPTEEEAKYITAAAKAVLYAIRVDPSSGGAARILCVRNKGGIVREVLCVQKGSTWKVLMSQVTKQT
jgi:hypothetical protein